ncbi:Lrp/AsnC family transcriptional regulator [Aureimonas fodinaquatilis]|uniref:Lrp/AsnC family transcriptional regulator n=1 Tax=Aureimonas fodinaquatilis TaxID=2565783 RepID=A0A5B0DRY3_9HYPH|nr:Lrp/AsnC family transcriptional regulator [Aureimonas fodinaquatilis]KAA0968511.1 Lrp/AsnC family transcriptional regulator [Aureimonas fodinaquatilis]
MLDATDLRILRAMQDDPEGSVESIGRAAGLSHTPCWRRIRRMQAEGILGERRYRINEKAIGLGVTVMTMIKLSRQDEVALEAFEKAAHEMRDIVDCYLVTGRYDFVLTILTRDTESFETLLKTKLSKLPHIAEMNSTVVLRKAKSGGPLPI